MYKILTIDGKDYKLEYTIEAALYKDCIDCLINFLGASFGVQGEKEITKGMAEEDKLKVRKELINNLRETVFGLPEISLTIFYAGLLEYHGEDGDKSVLSKDDAKKLVKQLFSENEEDGISDFAALLSVCMEQMGEDGFFKKTGLQRIMEQSTAAKPNRAARRAATKH